MEPEFKLTNINRATFERYKNEIGRVYGNKKILDVTIDKCSSGSYKYIATAECQQCGKITHPIISTILKYPRVQMGCTCNKIKYYVDEPGYYESYIGMVMNGRKITGVEYEDVPERNSSWQRIWFTTECQLCGKVGHIEVFKIVIDGIVMADGMTKCGCAFTYQGKPVIGEVKGNRMVIGLTTGGPNGNSLRVRTRCIYCGREVESFVCQWMKNPQSCVHEGTVMYNDGQELPKSSEPLYFTWHMVLMSSVLSVDPEHAPKVCKEWYDPDIADAHARYDSGFRAFHKWAMETGWYKTPPDEPYVMTLHRIEPNAGWFPDNCEWIHRARRNTVK